MKKHIFVATDGSDNAMAAVDFAAELAAKFGVPLTIGHVLQFGRSAEEMARMADVEHIVKSVKTISPIDFNVLSGTGGDLFADTRPTGDVMRAVTLIGDEILSRAVARAKELGARDVSTKSSRGDAADTILDMAETARADMIVVGHRGLGRVRTMLLGSVAHKVAQHAICTVAVIR